MALYELSTNAMKYGALADGRGPVLLSWHLADGDVILEWDEKTAVAPGHVESFGAKLVRAALSNEAETGVCYRVDSEGVYARFRWPATGAATEAPRVEADTAAHTAQ